MLLFQIFKKRPPRSVSSSWGCSPHSWDVDGCSAVMYQQVFEIHAEFGALGLILAAACPCAETGVLLRALCNSVTPTWAFWCFHMLCCISSYRQTEFLWLELGMLLCAAILRLLVCVLISTETSVYVHFPRKRGPRKIAVSLNTEQDTTKAFRIPHAPYWGLFWNKGLHRQSYLKACLLILFVLSANEHIHWNRHLYPEAKSWHWGKTKMTNIFVM